ncbi:hypothetical protein D3C85_563430 [compost metagenome]
MPRSRLMVLVLAVVVMHAVVLWLLLGATQPHRGRASPTERIAMEIVQITPPPKAQPPARPMGVTQPATEAKTPRTPVRRVPQTARIEATTATPNAPTASTPPAEPSQPIISPPAPLNLNSESTRRALRDVARGRSFADRANQDIQGPARSAFDSKLGSAVAGSAHGDCMKGQFKGSNMGLLSLPALAFAAANGDCAR